MKVDFYLPLDIIMDILSRLPIKTILSCKCVCKPWLDLIKSPEFSKSHLSKSVVSLAIYQGSRSPKLNKILEIVDELSPKNCWPHCNSLFGFEFPYRAHVHSSVNGLLFMYEREAWRLCSLYICNPITREYFKFPPPPGRQKFYEQNFGFGVSKKSGKYKLVKVNTFPSKYYSECEIYTLGTRSWRSIKLDNQFEHRRGAFLNGNLHWLAHDSNKHPLIPCFDLETEIFSTFSSPPDRQPNHMFSCISALGDGLCVCDNFRDEIVVWLMKEYGDEKSWTKEYSIKKPPSREMWGWCYPIKVSKDGDVWIAVEGLHGLACYSTKARAVQDLILFRYSNYSLTCIGHAAFYTPSFLSLQIFAMENVSSF